MSLQEAMEAIEGHQFAAELNLASGSIVFQRALENHRLFRELSEYANEPGAPEQILARLVRLSQEPTEPRYENPFDTAMTGYLTVLDHLDNPRILATAVDSVSKAPNCWWAAGASRRLLSKVRLYRLRQAASLGLIESTLHSEATTLGSMTGYESSPLSLASAPARVAQPFNRHRRKKRERAVNGSKRRPQQQVWPQLAQQQIA